MMEKEVKVTMKSLNKILEVPDVIKEIQDLDKKMAGLKKFAMNISLSTHKDIKFHICYKVPESVIPKRNYSAEVIYVDDNDLGQKISSPEELMNLIMGKIPTNSKEEIKGDMFEDMLPVDLMLGQLNVLELSLQARKNVLVDKLIDWGYLEVAKDID